MNGVYVGVVPESDPLQTFLRRVLGEKPGVPAHPVFRAFKLKGTNEVYAYEEEGSGVRVVGKFYGPMFGWDRDRAAWMAQQEYKNLSILRDFDLVGSPHHVIRPLGIDREINGLLATEYATGEDLSSVLSRAILDHDETPLYERLTALAYFLATLHNRTANGATVNFAREGAYLDTLVERLASVGRMQMWDGDELTKLRDDWRHRARMWQDRQVWLHGDATPSNFLFGAGLDVTAIDLERMKRGDRAFDVGRVAGELQHAFMLSTGRRDDAEPFIRHFLTEYCSHFPDRASAFGAITARTPYYMALNMLRIAGNDYITPEYAERLVAQAKDLLRAP